MHTKKYCQKRLIFQNLIKCTVLTVQVKILTVQNSTLLKNNTFLKYWQYKQYNQYMLPALSLVQCSGLVIRLWTTRVMAQSFCLKQWKKTHFYLSYYLFSINLFMLTAQRKWMWHYVFFSLLSSLFYLWFLIFFITFYPLPLPGKGWKVPGWVSCLLPRILTLCYRILKNQINLNWFS